MVDFAPHELGGDFAKNPDFITICKDLHDIWVELDLDHSAVQQEKQEVIKEVSAIVKAKLVSIRTINDQRLKKHRVLKVRAALEQWWIKCHFSEEQKREFEPYFSEDFNNELLKVHEQELVKLQQYHADNCHLFEVMDEYMCLYERHLQLEARDKDPDRLFDNRGGQLLKDERDRRAARKGLPALGRRVAALTADFERRYGRPFTRDGVGFEEALRRRAQSFKENALAPAGDVAVKVGGSAGGSTVKAGGSTVKAGGSTVKVGGSALKRKQMPIGQQHSKLQKLSVRKALM